MQFNRQRANRRRRFNLRRIGFNEDGNAHISGTQSRHRFAQEWPGAQHIQPAFRGQLRALFRHKAAIGRANAFREGNHLLGRRHFKIQGCRDLGADTLHITVLDVAAIFTQMHRNPIRARFNRNAGSLNGAGMRATARIAQCRHMINIHRKIKMLHAKPLFAAKSPASLMAAINEAGSARPLPAISKAVP